MKESTQAAEFIQELAEQRVAGIVVLDLDGRVIFVNPEAERLLGWSARELTGRKLHEMARDARAERGASFFEPVFSSHAPGPRERVRNQEDWFIRRDGSRLAVSYSTSPLVRNGEMVASVTVFRELSEERQREAGQQDLAKQLEQAHAQLLQSEKMAAIGQLAAGVAHEINNPVGYVSSNLSSLQSYMEDLFRIIDAYRAADTAMHPALAEARKLAERLELDFLRGDVEDLLRESQEGIAQVRRIVQDMKDFSHTDVREWTQADLHHGLDSTLNIVHNEIKYKAEVIKEYGDLPLVECVASQINQVFMNILVNAVHAIEKQGTIHVRTGTKGSDWVWVSITDDGCGMPPEVASRVFDPFFTTKPVGKGTGLGLSLAYDIVKKHAGNIDVESASGHGSTFRIWLPVHAMGGPGGNR